MEMITPVLLEGNSCRDFLPELSYGGMSDMIIFERNGVAYKGRLKSGGLDIFLWDLGGGEEMLVLKSDIWYGTTGI
jgi:hypothetical protein